MPGIKNMVVSKKYKKKVDLKEKVKFHLINIDKVVKSLVIKKNKLQ